MDGRDYGAGLPRVPRAQRLVGSQVFFGIPADSEILVASCSGANPLPTPIQRRSYTATLSQRGGEATMTLSGADFEISERSGNGNVVQGFVDDAAAMFAFEDAWIWGCTPMS